jgi:hypothetical protein
VTGGQGDPLVSVLVACSRPALVPAIAAALAAQDVDDRCELVVAGDIASLTSEPFPVTTTLVPWDPVDLHGARRRLVEVARGRVLAFLDDDARPEPGWLPAASTHPGGREVWTGPEVPVRDSPAAVLAFRVASSRMAEGYRGHVTVGDREAHWSEVPFCNLVADGAFLRAVGMPERGLAWDVDDFDLCRRAAAAGAVFRNVADLRIAHDRYPDSVRAWLGRKWRERRRTGQKLVAYPGLYLRLPGVVVGAVAPWVALGLLGRSRRRSRIVGSVAGAYLTAAAVAGRRQGCRGADLPAFVAAMAALHVTTVVAIQVGLLDGASGRIVAAGPVRPADS